MASFESWHNLLEIKTEVWDTEYLMFPDLLANVHFATWCRSSTSDLYSLHHSLQNTVYTLKNTPNIIYTKEYTKYCIH